MRALATFEFLVWIWLCAGKGEWFRIKRRQVVFFRGARIRTRTRQLAAPFRQQTECLLKKRLGYMFQQKFNFISVPVMREWGIKWIWERGREGEIYIYIYRERERERHTDRQTDRRTDGQTDGRTDRRTDRQRQTDRDRQRHRYRQRQIETDRDRQRQTGTEGGGGQTERHGETERDRETHKNRDK